MPLEDQEGIKNRIDKLMRERGWSIVETSKRAGLKNSTLYNVRGGKDIGADTLIKLAKAFDVSVEYLMGEQPKEGEQLTDDEQELLLLLRRVPASKRRAAVRVFRELTDSLIDS
jgi:transcriptional regulator with XRE-family HTH domain